MSSWLTGWAGWVVEAALETAAGGRPLVSLGMPGFDKFEGLSPEMAGATCSIGNMVLRQSLDVTLSGVVGVMAVLCTMLEICSFAKCLLEAIVGE